MGYFLVLIAIGLISRGIGGAMSAASFRRRSRPAEGIVVAIEPGGVSQKTYFPVVEFRDAKGRKLRFKSDFGARPPLYAEGETVTLRYLPERPGEARIERPWQIWWDPAGLTTLGLAAMATGMRLLGII